jgi:hypothetical protein
MPVSIKRNGDTEMTSKFAPSITIPTTRNDAPVISRFGDDDTYVELSFRRLGAEVVELVATKVDYAAFTGSYLRTEIGREVVGEEDAVNVACDMEWMSVDALEGVDGAYADPCGFAEAVERELAATAKADRDAYMSEAIAHNALIAAE